MGAFITLTDSQQQFPLMEINGTEGISKPFVYIAKLNHENDTEIPLLNENVSVEINAHGINKKISGIVTQVESVWSESIHGTLTQIAIEPELSRLKLTKRSEIFTNQTPIAIISDRLNQYHNLKWHNAVSTELPTKTFTHQYKESDFDFINRLCEHWGIYFYYEADDDLWVLADDEQYPEIGTKFIFRTQPKRTERPYSLTYLAQKKQPIVNGIQLFGYNPNHASTPITINYGNTASEAYESLSNIGIDDENEGMLIAERRLQATNLYSEYFTGKSESLSIVPGYTLALLSDSGHSSQNILITETALSFVHASNIEDVTLSIDFKAIPSQHIFRPPLSPPVPKANSSTATIYSEYESLDLAYRDDLGRYRVLFHAHEGNPLSHWIRRTMHSANDNHLDMPIPKGTEVQISYLDGNVDLPYISAALDNSMSQAIKSNEQHPYTTTISTNGMISIEAKRSKSERYSVSTLNSNQQTPPTLDPENYFELDNRGESTQTRLSFNETRYHLSSSQGDQYNFNQGQYFSFGDNRKFYFGPSYAEYRTDLSSSQFVSPVRAIEDTLFFEEDRLTASHAGATFTEQSAGFVSKYVGNRYQLHRGKQVLIRESEQGPWQQIQLGGSYRLFATASASLPTYNINDQIGKHQPTADDMVTEYRLNRYVKTNGNLANEMLGDQYVSHTGNYTREMSTGSFTSTLSDLSNYEHSISVSAGGEVSRTIQADRVKTNIHTSDLFSQLWGSRRKHIYGADNILTTGIKNTLNVGPIIGAELAGNIKTIVGAKIETIAGTKIEAIYGPVVKWASSPEIKNGPGNIKKEGFDLKQAEAEIKDTKAQIQTLKVSVTNALLTIIG